jgi:hypothetical protein
VVVGWCVRLREQGGFGATSQKPSHWGSVSGAPLETAVEGDGGRCWGAVYEVEVAAGWCV